MKLYFIIILLVFASCDKKLTEDFLITNNSGKGIKIHLENMNGIEVTENIPKNAIEFLLYTSSGYGNSVHEFELKSLFKYFEVTSDSLQSNINYLNNSLWEYKENSDTHAEFRLVIDSTYFW